MESLKHTPGPWYVLDNYGKKSIAVGVRPDAKTGYPYSPEDGAICVLYDGEYIENPNKVADAQLIASAPELLEALEGLVPCLDYPMAVLKPLGTVPEKVEQAKAAIQKARGYQLAA